MTTCGSVRFEIAVVLLAASCVPAAGRASNALDRELVEEMLTFQEAGR